MSSDTTKLSVPPATRWRRCRESGPLPYTHNSANGHTHDASQAGYEKKFSQQSPPHLDPTAAPSVAVANHAGPTLARGHAPNVSHARTTSQDAAIPAGTSPTGASQQEPQEPPQGLMAPVPLPSRNHACARGFVATDLSGM